LAILLPSRGYATETTSHGSDSGPPPGFNINDAKKPLPKEDAKKTQTAQSVSELKNSDEQIRTSKVGATAIDKTKALENASLGELATEKASESSKADSTAVAAKKEESKKLTLGQKIKKEIAHYWDGTKLLATEVRISSKLALKMAAGYELSRRENRQVGHLRCP
jgi:LETM1 and EF-hand domain-containing protein 1